MDEKENVVVKPESVVLADKSQVSQQPHQRSCGLTKFTIDARDGAFIERSGEEKEFALYTADSPCLGHVDVSGLFLASKRLRGMFLTIANDEHLAIGGLSIDHGFHGEPQALWRNVIALWRRYEAPLTNKINEFFPTTSLPAFDPVGEIWILLNGYLTEANAGASNPSSFATKVISIVQFIISGYGANYWNTDLINSISGLDQKQSRKRRRGASIALSFRDWFAYLSDTDADEIAGVRHLDETTIADVASHLPYMPDNDNDTLQIEILAAFAIICEDILRQMAIMSAVDEDKFIDGQIDMSDDMTKFLSRVSETRSHYPIITDLSDRGFFYKGTQGVDSLQAQIPVEENASFYKNWRNELARVLFRTAVVPTFLSIDRWRKSVATVRQALNDISGLMDEAYDRSNELVTHMQNFMIQSEHFSDPTSVIAQLNNAINSGEPCAKWARTVFSLVEHGKPVSSDELSRMYDSFGDDLFESLFCYDAHSLQVQRYEMPTSDFNNPGMGNAFSILRRRRNRFLDMKATGITFSQKFSAFFKDFTSFDSQGARLYFKDISFALLSDSRVIASLRNGNFGRLDREVRWSQAIRDAALPTLKRYISCCSFSIACTIVARRIYQLTLLDDLYVLLLCVQRYIVQAPELMSELGKSQFDELCSTLKTVMDNFASKWGLASLLKDEEAVEVDVLTLFDQISEQWPLMDNSYDELVHDVVRFFSMASTRNTIKASIARCSNSLEDGVLVTDFFLAKEVDELAPSLTFFDSELMTTASQVDEIAQNCMINVPELMKGMKISDFSERAILENGSVRMNVAVPDHWLSLSANVPSTRIKELSDLDRYATWPVETTRLLLDWCMDSLKSRMTRILVDNSWTQRRQNRFEAVFGTGVLDLLKFASSERDTAEFGLVNVHSSFRHVTSEDDVEAILEDLSLPTASVVTKQGLVFLREVVNSHKDNVYFPFEMRDSLSEKYFADRDFLPLSNLIKVKSQFVSSRFNVAGTILRSDEYVDIIFSDIFVMTQRDSALRRVLYDNKHGYRISGGNYATIYTMQIPTSRGKSFGPHLLWDQVSSMAADIITSSL